MNDSTVVVTGASRGIGAAVGREFASNGAYVILCARELADVEAVAADIEDAGGTVSAVRADVRDEFDMERLMETASRFGDGIDVVVANAGVYHGTPGETPITEESYSAFDDHLRTNTRGVFTTIREALPHLNEGARVLVPTGAIARKPKHGVGSYAVSKAGAEAVVRQFAVDTELVVGCVDPGQVATDLSGPAGRDPADVAPLFTWAATDCPAETLTGQVVGLKEWKQATR
jgi:NAD(P)-dependent dehydrogenase (short-subunit alcohol dehydrogenase family)